MNANSAIEKPTRNASARAVFRVRPLSRIMKNRADPRLAMIARKARMMMILTTASIS